MNMQTHDIRQVGEEALGKAIAARLCEGAEDLPHNISERLKAARSHALSRRKIESAAASSLAVVASADGALQFQGGEDGWWRRLASFLPLLALVAGLVSIAALQDDERARELAEIDAELLTDDLPPSAYTDPGFVQFLRARQSQ